MAFPTIPTVAAGRVVTGVQADTSQTRTFPSLSGLTKNSGDRLIAICIAYQSSVVTDSFFSWGGGFTEIANRATSTTMNFGIAEKISDGTETGTFTVTQSATVTGHACFILLSISGAHASTAIEVSPKGDGTSAAATVTAFDPSGWATEDTLWIAVGGSGETGTTGSYTGITGCTGWSNYVDTTISADVVGGVEGAVAFYNVVASPSVSLGGFTQDLSNTRNSAVVIAVRPALGVILTTGIKVTRQSLQRAAVW